MYCFLIYLWRQGCILLILMSKAMEKEWSRLSSKCHVRWFQIDSLLCMVFLLTSGFSLKYCTTVRYNTWSDSLFKMVLTKEYRICMPITVEEVSKHCIFTFCVWVDFSHFLLDHFVETCFNLIINHYKNSWTLWF